MATESGTTSDLIKICLEEYGRYVVEDRALADVRDGLKPSQRRLLWTLHKMNRGSKAIPVKCASVVGQCIAQFHPHGDSACYDALVNLHWRRYPLVDKEGNFGNRNGIVEDGYAAMRYCVSGTTRIRLENGISPKIVNLVPNAKPNSDNELSVTVCDRNGLPVVATKLFHSGTHVTRTVVTNAGFELTGTLNHPILCLVVDRGIPVIRWKTIEQVNIGDVVCISRYYDPKLNRRPTEEERNTGILLGMLVSEGWVNNNRLGFNNTDAEFFALAESAYRTLIGDRYYSYTRKCSSGKTLHEFDVQKPDQYSLNPLIMSLAGLTSYTKNIPDLIWCSSLPVKRAFLQALYEGDGSVSLVERNSILMSYTTFSRELAHDVQRLLLEFGIISRIYIGKAGKEYKVCITNRRDAGLFLNRVGFLTAKQELLSNYLSTIPVKSTAKSGDYIPFLTTYGRKTGVRGKKKWLRGNNFDRWDRIERMGEELFSLFSCPDVVRELVKSGFFYDTVKELVESGDKPVYSVRVKSADHSFITDGFVSHNTETRLSSFAERVLDDADVIPLTKSFTEEHEEPVVLLPRVPLLLVNGSSGVAFGISANLPPHNLQEVIDATVLLIEQPDISVKDLVKVLKGPDYGSGTLVSSRDDLIQLYETGQGKLSFNCEYVIEDTARGTKRLVITGLAPGFRKNKFITDTTALADQKLLVAPANDEGSRKTGTRVTVEFQDPKIIRDRILPLLRSSVSYQFYALAGPKRQPLMLSLKSILQKFIDFRRKVERAVLQQELQKLNDREEAEKAKLVAVDNLKVVLGVLELAETQEDAAALLMDKLKLNQRQAEVILGLQLKTLLRRLNRQDLLNKIEACRKRRQEIQQDLNNIDQVVVRRLRELSPYYDKRGTKLRGGERDLQDDGSSLYYVGVTQQAKIDSSDQPPVKSKAAWLYCGFVTTPGKFVVVSDDNVGQVVSLSYLDKFDPKIGAVVGVASEQHELVVAVSSTGQYVAFGPDQRRVKFPVFKQLDGTVVGAVGIGSADRVAVWRQDGSVDILKDLQATRPNVAAKPVKKRSRQEVPVVGVLPLRKGELLIDRSGKEVGSGDLSNWKPDDLVILGTQNLLVLQDGRRLVKSRDESAELWGTGTVALSVPIEVLVVETST
jgi:DNA gyrase subunit A